MEYPPSEEQCVKRVLFKFTPTSGVTFQIYINSPSKGRQDCMSKEKLNMTQPLKPLNYILTSRINPCLQNTCKQIGSYLKFSVAKIS